MANAIRTYKHENKTAEIFVDEDPQSPREWDNLGKMVCFHKGYDLGDKTNLKSESFNNWQELEEYLFKEENAIIVLKLSLYDHSGITMKIGSFNDRWDSGQVGFIYATKEAVKKEYGNCGKKAIEKATKVLYAEVETYDQYLIGDVYGYTITETKPKCQCCGHVAEEETDSCWGFFGIETVEDEIKRIFGVTELKEE